ncbi:MAG: peptidase MA family metallohydrolase [Candidatus Sericytochromatia bacterium]
MIKKVALSVLLVFLLQVNAKAHDKNEIDFKNSEEKSFNWGKSPNHKERDWKFIETEHFQIYYYQGFEKLAKEAADIGEEAYFKVTQDLNANPSTKIPVIITQDEFLNGFAEPVKNRIVLDPVLMRSSIIGARRFLTHEFTHIITYEAFNTGFAITKLYGVQNVPTWFMEGLAQYEAEYWYPSYDRMLRLNTLERSILTPSERDAFSLLGADEGSAGYNEGYSLVKYMFSTYGHDKLPKVLEEVKVNNISLSMALEKVTGRSLLVIEAEWRKQLEEIYQKQIENKHKTVAKDEVVVKKEKKEANISPKISPDGKIFTYMSSQGRSGYVNIRGKLIGLMPLRAKLLNDNKKTGTIAGEKMKNENVFTEKDSKSTILTGGVIDYAWSYDNRTLAVTQVAGDDLGQPDIAINFKTLKEKDGKIVSDNKYTYDYKIYDENDKDFKEPLRLFASPAFSPFERKLLFVAFKGEENNIYEVKLDDFDNKKVKIKAKNITKTSNLLYKDMVISPDDKYISFNAYKSGDGGNIVILDKNTNKKIKVTNDSVLYTNTSPSWSDDAKELYFFSDRTDISNLYKYELDNKKVTRLSDSYSGLEFPFFKNDYLYFTSYYAKGTDIRRIKKSEIKEYDSYISENKVLEEINTENTSKYAVKDYFPWLSPDIVLPITGVDERGDQIGLRGSMSDMLGKHSFNGAFAYGLNSNRFTYGITYINRMTDSLLGVQVAEYPSIASTQDAKNYYYQRSQGLTFVVTRPFFNEIADEIHNIGSMQFTFSNLIPIKETVAKDIKPENLREGISNYLSLNWNSENISGGYNSDTHPQNGYRFEGKLEHSNKYFGSKYEYTQLLFNFTKYFPLWFSHVLYIRSDLEYSNGNTTPLLLGGPPINLTLGIQDFIPLRGFSIADFSGDRLALLSTEYRFPILTHINMFFGGIYLDSIYGALFADIGDAWFSEQRQPQLNMGVGGELRLRLGIGGKGILNTYAGFGRKIFSDEKILRTPNNGIYFGFSSGF